MEVVGVEGRSFWFDQIPEVIGNFEELVHSLCCFEEKLVNFVVVFGRCLDEEGPLYRFHELKGLLSFDLRLQIALSTYQEDEGRGAALLQELEQPLGKMVKTILAIHCVDQEDCCCSPVEVVCD